MADDNILNTCKLTDEDLHAALIEMRTYIDITEEDLRKIYEVALRHAGERLLGRISVRSIMTQPVVTISASSDLRHAAVVLTEHRISGLPVVSEEGAVVGVLSEDDILCQAGIRKESRFRDLLHRLLGEPVVKRTNCDLVGDAMSSPAITLPEAATVHDAADILHTRRIKRLPVVDDQGRLTGIITRSDIVRVLGKR